MSAAVLKFVANEFLAPGNEAVAESLENFAAAVRDGVYGDLRTVLCVIEPHADSLTYQVFGDRLDRARAVGLLTMLACQKANE